MSTTGLQDSQREALETYRSYYSSFEDQDICGMVLDDATFLRYLRARNFSLPKAKKLLDGTINWRKTFGLTDLYENKWIDIILTENRTGKMYVRGFDREGHAIIYMKPAHENTHHHEGNVKHLVYNMERAIACMAASEKKQEKVILLIDYTGYSLFNAPPMKTSKETLGILQDHYPERLFRAYMINPPWIFNAFWTAISPFIDPVTRAKIVFVPHLKLSETIEKDIDLDVVESGLGGRDAVPFDSELYVTSSFSSDFHSIINDVARQTQKVSIAADDKTASTTDE